MKKSQKKLKKYGAKQWSIKIWYRRFEEAMVEIVSLPKRYYLRNTAEHEVLLLSAVCLYWYTLKTYKIIYRCSVILNIWKIFWGTHHFSVRCCNISHWTKFENLLVITYPISLHFCRAPELLCEKLNFRRNNDSLLSSTAHCLYFYTAESFLCYLHWLEVRPDSEVFIFSFSELLERNVLVWLEKYVAPAIER